MDDNTEKTISYICQVLIAVAILLTFYSCHRIELAKEVEVQKIKAQSK